MNYKDLSRINQTANYYYIKAKKYIKPKKSMPKKYSHSFSSSSSSFSKSSKRSKKKHMPRQYISSNTDALNQLAKMHKNLMLNKLKKRRPRHRKYRSRMPRYQRRRISNSITGLSHNTLDDIIKNHCVKIFRIQHPKVNYVDEYYPNKYIIKFLNNMLKNFQIKYIDPRNKRWNLEVFNNFISFKKTTKVLIKKEYIIELRQNLKDFRRFSCDEWYLIFRRIVDSLQKISNTLGNSISNFQNFVNFLRYRIIIKKIFKSRHMNTKQIKHLSCWIARHLKKHNWVKAGSDMGKLFSIVAENVDYLYLKDKRALLVDEEDFKEKKKINLRKFRNMPGKYKKMKGRKLNKAGKYNKMRGEKGSMPGAKVMSNQSIQDIINKGKDQSLIKN